MNDESTGATIADQAPTTVTVVIVLAFVLVGIMLSGIAAVEYGWIDTSQVMCGYAHDSVPFKVCMLSDHRFLTTLTWWVVRGMILVLLLGAISSFIESTIRSKRGARR